MATNGFEQTDLFPSGRGASAKNERHGACPAEVRPGEAPDEHSVAFHRARPIEDRSAGELAEVGSDGIRSRERLAPLRADVLGGDKVQHLVGIENRDDTEGSPTKPNAASR